MVRLTLVYRGEEAVGGANGALLGLTEYNNDNHNSLTYVYTCIMRYAPHMLVYRHL